MSVTNEELRQLITWNGHYNRDWDEAPGTYIEMGILGWGRSRRLGLFSQGTRKAYLGIQHVDPMVPGWGVFGQEQARFFISMFEGGRCLALRTTASMDKSLELLGHLLERD